jgi:hypothetical protein
MSAGHGSGIGDEGSALPVCEPAELTVTVHWDRDGNGGLRGQVIAENVGTRACRLPGKPSVKPLGLDGVPLPTRTVVTLEFRLPGYAIVQPGQRAAAVVVWSSWCGRPASDQAQVSWDDHTVTAHVHGPLQPDCTAGTPDSMSSSWFHLTDLPRDLSAVTAVAQRLARSVARSAARDVVSTSLAR